MIAAVLTAVWLGLLTAVSPCPLATNVAAVGFLGRHAGKPRRAMLAGLCYVAGRSACYAVLAAALSMGILAAARTSGTLSRFVGLLVGPLLIVAGAIILGLLPAPSVGASSARLTERLGARGDLLGGTLLGVVFALSFCPSSAALFFGGLLPLAAKSQSAVLVPVAYGLATGLPVLLFAVLLAHGGHGVGRVFARVQQVEKWLQLLTGLVILAVGLYLTVRTNFQV